MTKSWVWLIFFTFVASPDYSQHHHVHLHKRDFQNYENFIIKNVLSKLGKAFNAEKLTVFKDKELKSTIAFSDAIKLGSSPETVKFPDSEDSSLTEDVTIFTPFDMWAVNQLVLYGDKKEYFKSMYSIGLGYVHDKKQEIAFYISAREALKLLDPEEQDFLEEFFRDFAGKKQPVSLDSGSLAEHASIKLNTFGNALFKAVKEGNIKSYATDSLLRPMTQESIHYYTIKDSVITGLVAVFYLGKSEDEITFKKQGLGVISAPSLNGAEFTEQVLAFNRYDEWKEYMSGNISNHPLQASFQFYEKGCLLALMITYLFHSLFRIKTPVWTDTMTKPKETEKEG